MFVWVLATKLDTRPLRMPGIVVYTFDLNTQEAVVRGGDLCDFEVSLINTVRSRTVRAI